jgi:hypothetical protein
MLVAAGCSGGKSDPNGSSAPTSATPTVAPAKFTTLPDACKTFSSKTIGKLVPKAKVKGGTAGASSDVGHRASCTWNGLDDKGVKGSEYRWLDISLTRFDSDPTLGSGEKRAVQEFSQEVSSARASRGASHPEATAGTGIGDQSTTVTYTAKQTGALFAYAVVVARTQNVVLSLTYNGAGYSGAKSPKTSDLIKDAVSAAKEAVASVDATGGQTPPAPTASSGGTTPHAKKSGSSGAPLAG